MIVTCQDVYFSQPDSQTEGYVNIRREMIKPGARKVLEILLDYNYKSLGLKLSQDKLENHTGHMIQLRIRQLSWCLQGIVNWTPDDPLIEYEKEVCFPTEKDRFIETHFLRICPCTADCQWRTITLLIFGLCHDIVQRVRRDLRTPITLESIFSKANVYKFLSNYTEMTGPGQFTVKPEVPRVFNLPIKADIDLTARVFAKGFVTKDECLKPIKTNYTTQSIIRETSGVDVDETETHTGPSVEPVASTTVVNTAETVETVQETASTSVPVEETFGDMLERILKAKFSQPEN